MSEFKNFRKIYNEFKNKIFNYFLFKTSFDKELSEDLTEDVFEKVINNINSLRTESNLKVWIYKIAHNILVDYFRRKKELLIFDDEDENIEKKTLNLNIDNDFIGNVIDEKIKSESIKKYINELNETDKYLIALKFFDDLDYDEMEEIIGKNKIALRTGVSRALKKLKDIINKYQ